MLIPKILTAHASHILEEQLEKVMKDFEIVHMSYSTNSIYPLYSVLIICKEKKQP